MLISKTCANYNLSSKIKLYLHFSKISTFALFDLTCRVGTERKLGKMPEPKQTIVYNIRAMLPLYKPFFHGACKN